jgi:hypothetical protein
LMATSVYRNHWPDRINIPRYLRKMNFNSFIVPFTFTSRIISTMLDSTIICLLLHKTCHVIVVTSSIELKDWAVYIATSIPPKAYLQIRALSGKVNYLIFDHVESSSPSGWLPICWFLQHYCVKSSMS